VRLYREERLSLQKVADRLGVTAPTVRNWVAAAESADEEVTEVDDKAEIRRLQKALRRAQQDRDILKEAVAYFARESGDR
jgi:transposase